MALLSLGESKWRMLRRALKKKRFALADVRNPARLDLRYFEWLVDNGFFVEVGRGQFEVTPKGRAAADLGFYEV